MSVSGPRRVSLSVDGMDCASCVSPLESAVASLLGVISVSANLASERVDVSFDPTELSLAELVAAVVSAGHPVRPLLAKFSPDGMSCATCAGRIESAIMKEPGVVSAQVNLSNALAHVAYQAGETETGSIVAAVEAAWRALRAGTGNMDLLVALGTSAAYLLSVYVTWVGAGELYFEASAAGITLVLLGRLLETRAKRGTTAAIQALMALRPRTARVIRDGVEVDIPADAVSRGEVVLVKPGESLPVDGIILEGESQLDESLLTGESLPVSRKMGDEVTGGSINGSGLLRVEATRVGEESLLSQIVSLVEEAQSSKPPIQKTVDRVSAVFVPIVIGASLLTLTGWFF